MNRRLLNVVCGGALVLGCGGLVADDGVLTGDTRLACEAIMCLASGTRPAECSSSLSRYFSISFSDWRDTIQGRINFLNLCPGAQVSGEMSGLVSAMGNAVGRCDAQSLNMTMKTPGVSCGDWRVILIHNQLPGYCAAYYGHQYTNLGSEAPRYVGVPELGGFWSDAAHYDADLEQYNAHSGNWNSASQCYQWNYGYGSGAVNNWWQ